MMSSIAFSQKDTAIPVKWFPITIVKEIAKDLLIGDSAKALLKLTEEQLIQTENKVALKDSVIFQMESKEKNYMIIIDAERSKYVILEDHTKKVEKKLKLEKVKNKFTKVVSIGVISVLTFFLITK